MSEKEFRAQLARATALVATWPAWKRNILEQSSRPTVSVPRTPVDNLRSSRDGEKKPERED